MAATRGHRITFERSGGFAGVSLRTKVDTDKLEPGARETWSGLLEGLDLEALQARAAQEAKGHKGGPPDRFQYDVTIESGEHRYAFTYGDSALPQELRPLVDHLVQEARTRPVRE